MTETPEPRTEPTSVATAPPPPRSEYVPPSERPYRHNRLGQLAALIGIIAGSVFIIAVIFFSGFILGAHAGGEHHGGHHRHGYGMSHREGHREMGPWQFPGGPGGQMGPGGTGGYGPGGQQTPSTSPATPTAPRP